MAVESFDGALAGQAGTFILTHGTTTADGDVSGEVGVLIVPSSGTGALAPIRGSGGLRIAEGVHHLWLDCELG